MLAEQFHPASYVFDGVLIPAHQNVTGLDASFFSGATFGDTADKNACQILVVGIRANPESDSDGRTSGRVIVGTTSIAPLGTRDPRGSFWKECGRFDDVGEKTSHLHASDKIDLVRSVVRGVVVIMEVLRDPEQCRNFSAQK